MSVKFKQKQSDLLLPCEQCNKANYTTHTMGPVCDLIPPASALESKTILFTGKSLQCWFLCTFCSPVLINTAITVAFMPISLEVAIVYNLTSLFLLSLLVWFFRVILISHFSLLHLQPLYLYWKLIDYYIHWNVKTD